jgi:hypothetical protein
MFVKLWQNVSQLYIFSPQNIVSGPLCEYKNTVIIITLNSIETKFVWLQTIFLIYFLVYSGNNNISRLVICIRQFIFFSLFRSLYLANEQSPCEKSVSFLLLPLFVHSLLTMTGHNSFVFFLSWKREKEIQSVKVSQVTVRSFSFRRKKERKKTASTCIKGECRYAEDKATKNQDIILNLYCTQFEIVLLLKK